MKENDYIGKLVYEQFKKLEGKYDVLEKRNAELSVENTKMARTLEKVTVLVSQLVVKSTTGDWYMQSLWGREFDALINLLGIKLKEEEEDDTV